MNIRNGKRPPSARTKQMFHNVAVQPQDNQSTPTTKAWTIAPCACLGFKGTKNGPNHSAYVATLSLFVDCQPQWFALCLVGTSTHGWCQLNWLSIRASSKADLITLLATGHLGPGVVPDCDNWCTPGRTPSQRDLEEDINQKQNFWETGNTNGHT